MAFDLSTAKPVGGFDIRTAKPVSGIQVEVSPQDQSDHGYTTSGGAVFNSAGQIVYEPTPIPDPTEGMSVPEKYAAGAKGKLIDYAMGAQQLVPGLPDNSADVAEKKRLDAPLMATGAGQAGAVSASLLPMMATAGIPGINTYRGATALGGAMGLLEPVTGGASEKAQNALMGAGAGFAGQLGGNTIAALLRGGKALISPLFKSGQNELADFIIQQQAHDPAAAMAAAQGYQAATPGVVPTLAEATMDPGISALQRGVTGTDVPARHLANRQAILDALRGIAQNPQARETAAQYRDAISGPLYSAAKSKTVPVDQQFRSLMERPAIAAALKQIETNAENRGYPLSIGQDISGSTLHELKTAIDEHLIPNPTKPIGRSSADAIRGARQSVLDWIEDPSRIPEYGQARTEFSRLSRPIGQMDVGQELIDRLVPALSQAGNSNARLSASTLAKALRDAPDKLARTATEFDGATLKGIMDPAQLDTISGAIGDLGREQSAYDSALTRGSPTSQNLVTQNLIDQMGGSLGGPRTKALVSAITRYPLRVVDAMTAPLSQEINQRIAEKLSDSALGLKALQYKPQSTMTNRVAEMLRRATPLGALSIYSGEQ